MSERIYYREGYKYQLMRDYSSQIGIKTQRGGINTEFISLSESGLLTIRKHYAWDGASGPTLDTKDSMRGSLPHDALYQLMRMGVLPQGCRSEADAILERMLIEDGMNPVRAAIWRAGVEHFAAYAARYGTERPILTAP